MKKGFSSGYTIVETVIFLTITAVLFTSAALVLSGQQNRNQFTQAVNEANSQIGQIIDSVANGFAPDFNNSGCTASGNKLVFSGNAPQGSNVGCVLLGKAIQFKVQGTDPEQFAVFTVAGLRQTATGQLPDTYTEAQPTVVPPPAVDTSPLNGGLTVDHMDYIDGTGNHPIGAVAFLSSSSPSSSIAVVAGTQSVNLMPVPTTKLNDSISATQNTLDNHMDSTPLNPSGGVEVCFKSGGTNQSALITIGGEGRALTTKVEIKNSTDCT